MDLYENSMANPNYIYPNPPSQSRLKPNKPYEKALAMAYVPVQSQCSEVYSASEALKRGTLFPELDKPFLGKRGGY